MTNKQEESFKFFVPACTIFNQVAESDANTTQGIATYPIPIPNIAKAYGNSRKQLPQITDIDQFIKDLKAENVFVASYTANTKELIPSQTVFNFAKVEKMAVEMCGSKPKKEMGTPITTLGKPVLVASENYILDGHHRWLAHEMCGKKQIECLMIGKPMQQLVEWCEGKPYVEYKGVKEACVKPSEQPV